MLVNMLYPLTLCSLMLWFAHGGKAVCTPVAPDYKLPVLFEQASIFWLSG